MKGHKDFDNYNITLYMKDENLISLMAERDKLRAKIIALSKNKDTRSKYNSLISNTKSYEDITNKLIEYGRKLSIKTDILKVEYWKEQYRRFNENNPNIIMPNKSNKSSWVITNDNNELTVFNGTEYDFKVFYKGFKTAMNIYDKNLEISYKKL